MALFTSFETLIIWKHEQGRRRSPNDFINNNVEVENTVKFISFRDFHLDFRKEKQFHKTASKVATEVAWMVTRLLYSMNSSKNNLRQTHDCN